MHEEAGTTHVTVHLNDRGLSTEGGDCYSCTWKISVKALHFLCHH